MRYLFVPLLISSAYVSAMHNEEKSGIHDEKIRILDQLKDKIKNVGRLDNQMSVSYFADLKNGDTITADQFHSGPLAGRIMCTRHELDLRDDRRLYEIRLPEYYFNILQSLALKRNLPGK